MIGLRQAALLLGLFLLLPALVRAQDKVSIVGERDGSGQNFSFTVRNQSNSPIVWIEFPHYHADMFVAPNGWKQECTYLNVAGAEDRPGVCRAWPEPPTAGIEAGATAQFGMRLSRIGAEKGRGTVQVKFADGSTAAIGGVLLPVAPTFLDRYLAPIAMGAIFIVAILLHHRSRKKRPEAATAIEPT